MTATTEHPEEHHGGEELFVAKGHHAATDKQYILIALILMVMTAAEVTLSYMDVGWIFLPALLVLMTAKFLTVVSYFMHLKFDHKLFTLPVLHRARARRVRLRRRPRHVPFLRASLTGSPDCAVLARRRPRSGSRSTRTSGCSSRS